jgi:hypothetical protein
MFELRSAQEEARVCARVRLTITSKLALGRNIKYEKRGKNDYPQEENAEE